MTTPHTYSIVGSGNVGSALARIFAPPPDWTGKIIVDTTNSFLTPNADEILQGRLSSEFVAEAFPGADLVKAFNQVPANVLAAEVPAAHGKRVVFISSSSDSTSGVIAQLARDLGFAPIELGRIDGAGPPTSRPPLHHHHCEPRQHHRDRSS